MQLYPADPLALIGVLAGMNRPVDKSDFNGGNIPKWAREFVPKQGSIGPVFDRLGISSLYRPEMIPMMSNLTVRDGAVSDSDTYNTAKTTTYQAHPLGTMAFSRDGRCFRYATVGATDTVAGSIYQSAAKIANHLANTPPAVAAGATQFTYTPGATGASANFYSEGLLVVDTTPGNGYAYKVAGHGAITSATAFTLYLDPDDPIQVALTTSSRVGLHAHPLRQVIVAATTVTGIAVGGAPTIITGNGTAENFGWLQTRGPFPALINGTPAVGTGLVTSATTAGALDVAAVAAEINVRIIARAMQVGVSTKNNLVYLMLD